MPPQIQSVDKNNNQIAVNFTATTSGVNDTFADFRYHAVLVNDLTVSLQQAYLNGRNVNNGPMISVDTVNAASIVLPVSKPSRYYLAISTSGMRKSSPVKERIYSGWKLYTSSDSLPMQIMAGVDTTLYASAHYTGEDHSSAIAKITFATGKTVQKSFDLKNSGVPFLSFPDIREITSNGPVLVANNISEAVSGISSSIHTVVIKKDSADIVYYTVYTHLTNMSTLPDLSYNIAIPADPPAVPAKKVLAEGKIAIASDKGLENILSTTTLLTRLPAVSGPDTLNPLYQTTFGSIDDSLQIKLLVSILFHEAIAHNSPKANEVEENAGIFTNYIQYFDNVVKRWGSVNDYAVGLPRLRTIFRVIKERNAFLVADNVWSLNHGTLAEFGKPIQERKNYAFYEGYSRLHFDLEKPNYTTGVHTGAGIQMKISDNIELYKANLADTFNMFDTAIINGTTSRRIIVNAKDSLLDKVNTDGIWVKGIMPEDDNDKSDKIWYTGVNAVRLPLSILCKGSVKVDTAFTLDGAEKMVAGDVGGKVVGGSGRSLLKVYALSNDNKVIDTIENIEEPGVLLHGQKRKLVYNSDYLNGNKLDFRVATSIEDTGKLFIESHTDNNAILADTSVTSKNWIALANVTMNGILVQSIGLEGATRRLGMKDVVDGNLEVWCDKVVPIAMETDVNKLIRRSDRRKIEIVLRATGDVKIYTNSSSTGQIFPDVNNLLHGKIEENGLVVSWDNYDSIFLKQNTLYASIEPGTAGKFEIIGRWKKTMQEETKECLTVLGVPKIESIAITSDYSDEDGYNLLRINARNYLHNGFLHSGAEWQFSPQKNVPTVHPLNSEIVMVLDVLFPKKGMHLRVEGKSTNQNLILKWAGIVDKNGLVEITMKSEQYLATMPTVFDNLNMEWLIFDDKNNVLEKINTDHKIYVSFNKPIVYNSGGYLNYITDKRADLIYPLINNVQDSNNAVEILWNNLQDTYFKQFLPGKEISKQIVWAIIDCAEYPEKYKRGGECAEFAILLENMCKVVGINSLMKHLKPSADYIKVSSLENILPDTTRNYHAGDEYILLNGRKIYLTNVVERMVFHFSFADPPWQRGEGCVYYNNKMYTMFANNIIGAGNGVTGSARNALTQIEQLNQMIKPDDWRLQRWCVIGGYKNKYVFKECILQEGIPIP